MAYTKQKGGNVVVTVDATAVECLTTCSLSLTTEEVDTTCKNATNTKSFEPGATSWEVGIGGTYTDGTGANEDFHTLMATAIAKTQVVAVFGGVDSGDIIYTGNAYIFNIQADAPNSGEQVTWTATLKGDGALTPSTLI